MTVPRTDRLFVDTNVPIYAAGADHPLKAPCLEVLRLIVLHPQRFVTDAEVFQELLHRYLSIRAWSSAEPRFLDFAWMMRGRIEAVRAEDVINAARSVSHQPWLSARDLVHLAVMGRLGVTSIISGDRDFDRLSGIRRLAPEDLDEWWEE